jgi:hypothetical protein
MSNTSRIATKTSRPDRVEKLKKRQTTQTTTVKSALQRYIHCSKEQVLKIKTAIDARVEAYSKQIVSGSIALAGIVKERFAVEADPLAVDVNDIFDQTFIRQLLVGTEDANKPVRDIRIHNNHYPALRATPDRYLGDRNIYSAATRKYVTNLKNALRFTIDARIRTFCTRFSNAFGLSKSERIYMLYSINGWTTLPPSIARQSNPVRRAISDTISEHRRVLFRV